MENYDDVVGFHLRLAQAVVHRHFSESLAEWKLTQSQLAVLWLVADHPGIAQTTIGQHLQMDRATTMAVVNRLQSRGFIERGKSLSDGRKQTLNLTGPGLTVLAGAQLALGPHEAWLKARYTAREVAVLVELLGRLGDGARKGLT